MNKITKKALSLILACSFCPLTVMPNVSASERNLSFNDISGHWAENDIEFLHDAELVNGVSESEFAPDTTIDKAQFVTMLVRALGGDEDIYSVSFSDVSIRGDWFAGYLGAAINAGIIENSVFAFNPTGKILRSDVAVMINNAINYIGFSDEATVKKITYSDIADLDGDIENAISAVSVLGIMNGVSEYEFAPNGYLTRAEASAIIKRLALVAGTLPEIKVDLSSDEMSMASINDGVVTLNGDYSYVAIDNVDFHYNINQLEVSVSSSAEDLQLELWIDSLDPLTGIKLGTVELDATGAAYKLQTARIFKTYGNHKIYLRLLGAGTVSIKSVSLKNDAIVINPKNIMSISGEAKKKGDGVTNLKLGSSLDYGEIEFGKGYDTVELTMENSVAGQLFEVWLGGEKTGVIETVASDENRAVAVASVVKAEKTKKLELKPITDVDGVITDIKFYNALNKADICMTAEQAETNLEIIDSADFYGGKEISKLSNGDVVKFSDVNFCDGFNLLTARVKKNGFSENNAYIEVRLDSEDGPVIGKLQDSIIESPAEYDMQSCTLYNTFGVRDLYLKAIGDIGWNIEYIKLQERGWYKSPIVQIEAERMTMHNATVNDPNDESTYAPSQFYAEASGRSAVLIEENGGYVEFTIPEWFEANDRKTAITVRHSITDWISEKNYSLGQDSDMSISVNGKSVQLMDSFKNFEKSDTLTISSKMSRAGTALHFFNDSTMVIDSVIEPGDIIRLTPHLDENVTYCYIDLVDLEVIPEKKEKPEGYISIEDCGAVANDMEDDGIALRLACEKAKNNPEIYSGVWIPDGQFDIKSYIGDRTQAADFCNIRILGSGLWYSKIQNHENACISWNTDYNIGNTVMRDFAIWGYTWQRGWATSAGDPMGAICFSGSRNNFVSDMWFEHWNAVFWLSNASGVYDKMRMKDNFADGINIHQKGYGIIYSNSLGRGNGDDSFAIFSESKTGTHTASNILIKNNTIETNCWGGAIKVWGGNNIRITHNLCKGANSAIGFNSDATVNIVPAPSNVWVSYNRLENVGNWMFGHYSGAFIWEQYADSDLPAFKYVDNTIGRDIYIENNDTIDNPHNFFYNYCGGESPDEIYPIFRYNYIRNVGLNQKDTARIVQYDTSKLQGEIEFSHNIFEGNGVKFAQSKAKDDMLEQVFHENVGEIWED